VGIPSCKYNNQQVPKPLVLVKAVGKGKTNTQRVDFLIHLISLINLLEVLLVVRAMDMVTSHLGIKENYLLMNKRKRFFDQS
jgi:hypothetical protein